MLFENADLNVALFPILLLLVALTLCSRHFFWKKEEKPRRLLKQFRLEIILMACFLVVLLASLPFYPALMSFHFPNTIKDVSSAEQILTYLQIYNREIVRTVQVLFWIIFEFIIFMSLVYNYVKSRNEYEETR